MNIFALIVALLGAVAVVLGIYIIAAEPGDMHPLIGSGIVVLGAWVAGTAAAEVRR